MPRAEYADITCELGIKTETPGVEGLDYFQNLGIVLKNTLVLKTKFTGSPETEIYLPVEIDTAGNFTTKLMAGRHTLEITVSKEDYNLTAKHWSQ